MFPNADVTHWPGKIISMSEKSGFHPEGKSLLSSLRALKLTDEFLKRTPCYNWPENVRSPEPGLLPNSSITDLRRLSLH